MAVVSEDHDLNILKNPSNDVSFDISSGCGFPSHSGDATLESGCSQEHPDLKKKMILYIIIKIFLFVYPLKKMRNTLKKMRNTLKFFFFLKKKNLFIILSSKKKKKAQKKFELKSEKIKNKKK